MKNILKTLIYLLVIGFTSCNNELYNESFQEDKKPIIQNISLKEIYDLKIDNKLIETVEQLKQKQKIKSKLVHNAQFNFYIDDEKGVSYEKDGVKSYTFQIFRENATNKIENIVFVLNQANEIKVFNTKYTLTKNQIEDLSHDRPIILNNLNNNFEINTLSLKADKEPCYKEAIYSQPADTNSQGQVTFSYVSVIMTLVPCPDDVSTGNTTTGTSSDYNPLGNSSSPFYPNNSVDGSTTSGGGNISSGSNGGNVNPPIITTPIVSAVNLAEAKLRKTFTDKLNPQQLSFFNSIGILRKLDFFNFLFANSIDPENVDEDGLSIVTNYKLSAVAFAKEAIDRMRLNANLKIDLQKSLKSPAYIDISSIDNNTPAGKQFNAIYNALTASPKFKEMFIDMFQNNSLYEVKFQIGNTFNNANGQTDTNLNNPTCNIITMNPNYINSSNKMEIAKTIIHEFIHAYLNVKLCDANQGVSIPTLNNGDLFNVINQQYNGFVGSDTQHNFIYNYMLPVMETILSQIKDLVVTPENNTEILTNVTVSIPYGTPSTPFIWNDYYHNLSLAGLHQCQFFQNEIATITISNGTPTPSTIVNQILYESFIMYNVRGSEHIRP